MKCYIAGPMRGIEKYNYPAFNKAAAVLRAAGWLVYNPAEMDANFDVENYSTRSITQQQEHDTNEAARHFARRDVNVILNELKGEDGDAIYMLPGFEGSTGAKAEIALGRWVGLKTIRYTGDLL